MNRNRGYYRRQRKRTIQRKERILGFWGSPEEVESWERGAKGRLSKGKIHCSCPICRRKSYDDPTIRDKRAADKAKNMVMNSRERRQNPMRERILNKLHDIEKKENVRILLAVESGSRAWGFASPDSDYDVRFIYVRPREAYLRLEKQRDVIELPIEGELDINGWDLNKTLRLLHASNPTLFEWFSSPVVYRETAFADEFRAVMQKYFSSKRGLGHYLSMAGGNYREFLTGDTVKAKKYFYVLRPVLACRWILEKGTPPPMLFSELAEAELDPALLPDVKRLLDLKMNAPEIKVIPKIESINKYLESSIREVHSRIVQMPEDVDPGWEELNQLFLSQIQ